MLNEEVINNLREALKHSPNNIPLKMHLALTLLDSGEPAEAEAHFKEVLALDDDHVKSAWRKHVTCRRNTQLPSSSWRNY
jgi:cytochrome c-type biogenesis protein CcmH/NrfG